MSSDLLPRLSSGIIFLALMIGGMVYSPTTATLLFLFIVLIGSREYFLLTGWKGASAWGLAALAALCYLALSLLASPLLLQIMMALMVICAALGIYRLYASTPIGKHLAGAHGLLLLAAPFAALSQWIDEGYLSMALSCFVILWTNDSLAYVTGRAFGKTKLMPEVSPGKTWEGFIGGLLFAGAVSVALGHYWTGLSLQASLVVAVIISVLGTAGDLFESRLKRSAGVKDSGNLMPGHGGLLDRFDGILLSIPIVHFISEYGIRLITFASI